MTRLTAPLALLPILLLGIVPGHAAPADDYVALRTALEIDKACIALKYMEFTAVRSKAQQYLESTTQHIQSTDGRLSADEYDAWRAGLDEQARTVATTAGCTQQAMSHVLTAKAVAADQLYQGLLLAFHFDSLPDFDRIPLDGHKKQSAMGYEAYLRQLYGQNFEAFAKRQRDAVVRMLPAADLDVTWSYSSDVQQQVATLWDLQLRASSAMNAVQFEVTAEANGYFVRPYWVTDAMFIPALHRPELEGSLPIVAGPGYQLVDGGEELLFELYSVAAMLPDRRLGVLFYGDAASKRMQSPTVRLYVPRQPYPEGRNGFTAYSDPSFRDNALVFEGNWASDGCLGAPCYDFPIEATEALLADPGGINAELFVSFSPDDQPAPIGESSSNTIDTNWMQWWAGSLGGQ